MVVKIVLPKPRPKMVPKVAIPVKNKPGPKPTGKAMTVNERAKRLRDKMTAAQGQRVGAWLNQKAVEALEKGASQLGSKNEAISTALLARFQVDSEFPIDMDLRIEYLQQATKAQLSAYLHAKGWRKVSELNLYFDGSKGKMLREITMRQAPGQRSNLALLFLRDLPNRADLLTPNEVVEKQSALEEVHHRQAFEVIRSNSVKLFSHFCYFTRPNEAYRYFHLAKNAGNQFDNYSKGQAVMMTALLTEQQRAEEDAYILGFMPVLPSVLPQ